MRELPGKDSGKGNPMEAALVTLRLAGVWSGDQQPWGEREEVEVPWREGGRAPLSGRTVSSTRPRPQGHPSPSTLVLGLTPGNSGSVFHRCVFRSVQHSGGGESRKWTNANAQGDGRDPRSQSSG